MDYEGIVYRPPSEARSLIIQVTIGCAHNTCGFCNMYKEKKFRIRSLTEILADLTEVSHNPYASYIAKIMNVTESNVKVRLTRGRRLLRNVLKEEWENDR